MGTGKLRPEKWMANERTLAQHLRIMGELNRDIYPNLRTYSIDDLRAVRYNDGYQVTFWHDGDEFTPRQYADVVNEFLQYAPNHITNASKDNDAKISFRIPNLRTALRLARKYDQFSIWDWKTDAEVQVERRRS